MDATRTDTYSQKWQDRFAFFDQHGAPNSPGYKEALKALPTWGARMKINFNWLAWLFGPFYFLVVGMWRKALTAFGIAIALGVVTSFMPGHMGDMVSRGAGIGLAVLFGMVANYSYYLKERQGQNGWNLFEGLRW